MGKLSTEDKMRIQTLYEQGLRGKAIVSAYPDKQWKLRTVEAVCKRVRERGSAVMRRVGSGRPKTARSNDNIDRVAELICSQEDQPGTSLSTRQVAELVNISATSVRRIVKQDLQLKCFKRTPAQVLNAATKQKRLVRSKALLRRLTVPKLKRVFFTDEKTFYLNPPVSCQNKRVWNAGKKSDVAADRLILQRAKFSAHVMVSAGVCYRGKGRLHFIKDKAKINADYYVNNLLPVLIEDCNNLLPGDCIFQQDGAPAHTSRLAQDWLGEHCPELISKDEWPPNSPDLNPLDYHVWGMMLQLYQRYQPKPTNTAELKVALQAIWDELPQEFINKAVLAFRRRLQACIRANGGHFEHVL